ncbi:MAG TPA: ABC transporter permease [Polyangiales bacterium]|nr:ABC transporter permease [Polyangiales bacterium]
MRWRPIAGIMLRQFYLMRTSPARLLPMFAWVAIDIVLWGFISRYLNTVSSQGLDFIPHLLGAVLFWDFFTRVMQGVTTAFFEDVWSRNFLNIFATPLSITEYVAGLIITSMITSALGLCVMFLLSTTLFGLPLFAPGLWLIPFLLVLFLFGIALGIAATALVLRLGPASEWLVWPIPALLSPFAGVFYPLSTLPTWMQWVGKALPPSYVFESLRGLLAGQPVSPSQQLLAAGLALLHVLLASALFTHVYRYAVRHGLLARYSAEGIG